MREMGVRELKQTLSETLRRVARGEAIRVTSRGRALADIVPAGAPPGDERLRQLIIDRRLVPPSQGRPAQAPSLVTSSRSATELVLSDRDEER